MADECWNDDIAYGFSIHRTILRIAGMWPLQKKTVFVWIRWIMLIITQLSILVFLLKDVLESDNDIGANLEGIMFLECLIITITKISFITYHQKKLAVNMRSAIDDWLLVKNDEETRKIMKKYTFKTRILMLTLLCTFFVCFALYLIVIAVMNLRQILSNPIEADVNKTNWMFIIPSGRWSNTLTGSQYVIIIIIQIYQSFVMCYIQSILDGFYFGIVLHLVGQLELLKKKCKTVLIQSDTQTNYRKRFINLVNRHSELIKLNENLEDSFQIIIFVEIVVMTIAIALIGLRILWCLNVNNYIEFLKSFLVINYVLLQTSIYAYGGDFLQTESEDIFYILYTTSWFTLPAALMKDFHFMMMRSSIPFRLSGGKLFDVDRHTMMSILKTVLSFISFLRVVLQN